MANNLDQIISDLLEADPSLKPHEAVLRKLAMDLMQARPDAPLDEAFRQDLRRQLLSLSETKQSQTSLINNLMKRFQFLGAGLAVFALLIAGAVYLNGIKGPNLTSMLSAPQISRAGDNAFGSLAGLDSTSARGQSGGGSGLPETTANLAMPVEPDGGIGSGGGSMDEKLIAPAPVNYNYVYVGEELSLAQERVDVLKRVKNAGNNSLSNFISQVSLGLIDLGSFSNAELQSFTFVEDRDRGYMVSVMLNEGQISINEHWEKWLSLTCPAVSIDRGDMGTCPTPRRLDPSDIPADEVVINTANAFLDVHGIPRGNYGTPVVNNDWRVQYELAADKSVIWVPETVSVIYPLILNGQEVYDESGNVTGMNVSVRVSPEVAVSGIYELTTQNYQSSSYEAETDVNRIMDLVAQGGFRNYYYVQEDAESVDVEIGTPEVGMVKLWSYKNNMNEELLVPALIFPVTQAPDPAVVGPWGWYRKNLVIPLVKEILDNEGDGPRPMPLDGRAEPAVGDDTPTATPVPAVEGMRTDFADPLPEM